MKNLLKLLSGLVLVLLVSSPSWAVITTTLTIPVVQGSDDHEEKTWSGDKRSIASGDLDLGRDGSSMTVGVRFQQVTIPQGAKIVSAYIQFVSGSAVETLSYPQNGEVKLRIKGESKDNALTFVEEDKNIKNRWDSYATTANIYWTINTSWANKQMDSVVDVGTATPELKTIAQEIVDRSGWTSGNAMVFMLSRSDKDNKRVVYSYEGSPVDNTGAKNYAPKLIISYESNGAGGGTSTVCTEDIRVNANIDDADDNQDAKLFNKSLRFGDKWVGLRFAAVPLPQGAEIIKASLKLATGQSSDGFGNKNSKYRSRVKIWGQKSDTASSFTTVQDNMKDRPRTTSNVEWTERNFWNTYKEVHTSPDISNIVQEIIGRSGWSANNAIALLLEDDKGRRPVLAYDDNKDFAPLLHVEYSCGSGGTTPVLKPTILLDVASSTEVYLGSSATEGEVAPSDTLTITNSGAAALNYTITGMPAWFSLSTAAGSLAKGDFDTITVTYGSASLAVGTYKGTLTITDPTATNPDQTIPISLYIYPVPDTSSSCSNVPLYVKNQVSPAVLINLDLSGSMKTMMPVTQTGNLPRTPDLSAIVQEIVNTGTSWIPGNDMVFIVTGASGHRRAWSYNGQNGSAPELFVTYSIPDGLGGVTTTAISKRIASNRDDAEQKSDGTSYSDSRSELNFGTRVIGMRFQNLTIPQGATITRASITFNVSSTDTGVTSLTFYGEKIADAPRFSSNNGTDVTSRTKTAASVGWGVPVWDTPTEQSRLAIAQGVIGDIVQNRNINWGFGTWTGNYASSIDYTKVEVGCKENTDAQQIALQAAVLATSEGGRTPFVPSMDAAGKYFKGTKLDISNGKFASLTCQDKFLIEITDGLGNIPDTTSAADAASATKNLATDGVSSVAVGFGIDNATLINAVASTANKLGNVSEADGIYALHDEVGGVGKPFLAMNQNELLNSLLDISHKIENRFTGSAPAPTTSADDADLLMVLVAEFGSASWTGDLRAIGYSLLTNDWTKELWKASELVPASRNIWTAETGANGVKVLASSSSGLKSSNYLCKDIGDIIDSAPVIVKWPNSHYSIDSYSSFATSKQARDKMVYVGANDGQLHAFALTNSSDGTVAGTERWSFIPPYLHAKLNKADADPSFDQCDAGYCHQYYVDGSPVSADIYVNNAWHTILVTGLREGGEAYFALDVTDGKPMQADTTTGAQFLWQFTDDELGQTWADASIKRVVDISSSSKMWGAFMGSGYSTTSQATKEAYLFGIDAYDASPLWKNASNAATNRIKLSSTTLQNDALSELLVLDKDYYADFAADFIYAGNLYGDLYRVSNIGKGQKPVVSILYESNNASKSPPSRIQPIRARPSAAYAKTAGEFWLYFGTGRYENIADKTSTDPQYFFGLKEKVDLNAPGSYTTKYVKPATLDSAPVSSQLAANGSPADLKLVALDATAYTVTVGGASKLVKVIRGANPLYDPWAIRLGKVGYSERVLNQPLVVGGVVFFTSFIPDDDPCGGSGSSFLYAVDFNTGLAPTTTVFDLNDDGVFNDNDKILDPVTGQLVNPGGISLGKGQASQPIIVGDKIFTTTTDPGSSAGPTDPNDPNKPDNPPPKPTGVSVKGLRASMDSWLDTSFE